MRISSSNSLRAATVVLAASFLIVGASGATIIDGVYDAGEGYTHSWLIVPSDTHGTATNGQLHMAQDSTSISFAVILPTTYVDNSYGDNAVAAWGDAGGKKDKKGKKGKKGHTFDNLLKSDHAGFSFYVGARTSENLKFAFVMDYLYEVGNKDSGLYDSGVLNGGSARYYDGELDGGLFDIDYFLAAETSLDYNIHDADGNVIAQYLADSPSLGTGGTYADSVDPNWVFDATYEFRIDAAAFGGISVLGGSNDFANGFGLWFDTLHASPNMGGEFEDIPPTEGTPPTVVPEPSSMALLGLGLVGVTVGRVRKKRNAA